MFGRTRTARRSPLLRALSLASALALVLTGTADAYGLHRCSHHDALPGGESSQPATGDSDAASHAHDHGVPSSDSHDDAGCTCVGDCTGPSSVAEPEATVSAELVVVPQKRIATPIASDCPRPDHAPHFQPFAQAPPVDR